MTTSIETMERPPGPAPAPDPGNAPSVRRMFASIAGSYDRANQILSFGLHHRWRSAAVKRSGAREGDRVLDCATGTGDLAMAFRRAVGPTGDVVATDFCEEMLAVGRAKSGREALAIRFEQADALDLPYEDGAFDVASIAFGIRNVEDPERGLREMARVVRAGGRVVVLEFGQPDGVIFGPVYRLYSHRILPVIGGWVTGQRAAYEYFDRTSSRFLAGERFVALMRGTGAFRSVSAHPMTGGVAYVYVGDVGGGA